MKLKKLLKIGGIIVVGLWVIGVVTGEKSTDNDASYTAPSGSQAQNRVHDNCRNERYNLILARNVAEDLVKRQLKSPSSARFGGYNDSFVLLLADCRFEVRSWVEAQNSFGAQLRQNYLATVQYHEDGDRWTLIDVQFEE